MVMMMKAALLAVEAEDRLDMLMMVVVAAEDVAG